LGAGRAAFEEVSRLDILYVTTVSSAMGFFPEHIKMLQREGHTVELACNLEKPLPEEIAALACRQHHIPFSRSPLCKDNATAYRVLKKLLSEKHYDIVHTHTPNASALVRLACRKLRRTGTKVFYTAHGFHFYTGARLKNWLIYYPVEKFLSRYTDVLITINKEDHERAQKKFKAKEIVYVPGVGIDLKKFSSAYIDRNEKRRESGIGPGDRMLLSVGELSAQGNHRVVIEALAKLNDPSIHYFIAGSGGLENELEKLAREKGVDLHLLGVRADVSGSIQASNLVIFPSLQESLPAVLMEAIACKIPVVCSALEENTELVGDPLYLFDPSDSEELAAKIKNALTTDDSAVIKANYDALLAFDLGKVNAEMEITGGGVLCKSILRQRLEKELGIEKGRTLILSVGELNENKNHMTVIKALAGMSNVEYLIAGEGGLKDKLKDTAEALGVHLHLLGYRTDVAELYRACDLYVLPSFREGLNVSLMEAMSSGSLCAASNIRGNRDLIDDLLFDPADEDDVRATLIKASSSCFGSRSYKMDPFGKEAVVKRMQELYAEYT